MYPASDAFCVVAVRGKGKEAMAADGKACADIAHTAKHKPSNKDA
jgi:hypothetical protein